MRRPFAIKDSGKGRPAGRARPRREGVVLRAANVHKSYGEVQALRGAHLEVKAGEIHGLVGENGSGKSTMLKVLAGTVRPDAGEIEVNGSRLELASPPQAIAAGIVTVTQETTLVPDLSVAENVLLGRRLVRGRWGVDWKKTRERAAGVLRQLALDLDSRQPARELAPHEQQMVEIARAVSMDARVLILDEPTSLLTEDEVDALSTAMRRLRTAGVGIVFVSHRIEEVLSLCDHLTIFRTGRFVESRPTQEYDAGRLITAMVGKEVPAVAPLTGSAEHRHEPVLRLTGLRVGHGGGVSLQLVPGETVGLAGLAGSGRSELLQAIAGLLPCTAGQVEINGKSGAPSSRTEAIRSGVAYVPAERKVDGLVLGMSIRENLLMVVTALEPRWARPHKAKQTSLAREMIERYHVVANSTETATGNLSGGNQQKVVLAKWMGSGPRILLLDEPTRGVDAGAKAEIYKLLDEARRAGAAIIVNSSEYEELRTLCERILVFAGGRCVGELGREEATDAKLARLAMA